MTDYIPQPIVIRDIPGVAIVRQVGDQIDINGIPGSAEPASYIISNPQHYLRKVIGASMPRLENGEVAAVARGTIDGKDAHIMILAAGWADGAPERARYAAWRAGRVADKTDRQARERAYDLVNNEGGEGYNPHRTGDARTYVRTIAHDRDYPEGA